MTPRALAVVAALVVAAAAGCRSVDAWEDIDDPEMEWRAKAAAALGEVSDPAKIDAAAAELAAAWEREQPGHERAAALVRHAVVTAFGRLGTKRAGAVVAAAFVDPDPRVRAAAARTAGRLGDLAQVPALLKRLAEDDRPSVRAAAAAALGDLDDPDEQPRLQPAEVEALIAGLDDEAEVAVAAHRALQQLTQQLFPRDRRKWAAWWKRWKAATPRGRVAAPPGG